MADTDVVERLRRTAESSFILTGEQRELLRAAADEIERLMDRLEMRHVWQSIDGKMTRVSVEPGSIPDGIECRDETIKLQGAEIERIRRSPYPAVGDQLQRALNSGMVKIVASNDLFSLIGPMRGLTRGTAELRVSQLMREAWNKLPPFPDSFAAHSPKETPDG